jgi:hypothetical protein
MKITDNNKLAYVCELSFIRSLYDLVLDDLKPGRLQHRFEQLQIEADKALNGIYVNQLFELPKIKDCLDLFAEKTGWNKKKRSTGTILSFLLRMIEESDFNYDRKLTDILNEIIDYFERVKPFSVACYWAGDVANDKWIHVKSETLDRMLIKKGA